MAVPVLPRTQEGSSAGTPGLQAEKPVTCPGTHRCGEHPPGEGTGQEEDEDPSLSAFRSWSRKETNVGHLLSIETAQQRESTALPGVTVRSNVHVLPILSYANPW